jgi:rubrerythrin
MKTIVKQPHIVTTETYKYFICNRCNCEFYATDEDVTYVPGTFLESFAYESNCPVCGKRLKYTGFHEVEISYAGEEAVKTYLEAKKNGRK